MSATGSRPNPRAATYYQPLAEIREVSGVRKTEIETRDFYQGTMEALVSAGFPADLFPGQPGRPVGTVSYRPIGVSKGDFPCWWRVPGYLQIFRYLSGQYTVALTVSVEVRNQRAAEAIQPETLRRARRDVGFQSILSQIVEAAR